jgi:hypothetical protein
MGNASTSVRIINSNQILVAWANAELVHRKEHLRDVYRRLKRLVYPHILKPSLDDLRKWQWAGQFLRHAWHAPTEREFEWYMVEVKSTMLNTQAPPPKQVSTLETVFAYFRRNWKTAHYCANPDCPAPYFFARRNQKFCSRDCSRPSQLESKRRFWHKHKRKSKPTAVRRKRGK